MRDGEWSVRYPGVEFTFGTGATPVFNITTPDLGDYAIRAADADNPRGDGVSFGVDFLGGRTIAFDIGIHADNETDVRTAGARLGTVWRADKVRLSPGTVAELWARYNGRERLVYGRPRRFAPNMAQARTHHFGTVQADFACADTVFYAGVESVYDLSIVAATGGGLLAPLASPLATTLNSDRSTGVRVGGEIDTWPIIEIAGPITNPTFSLVDGWGLAFGLTLAYDETLVVDTRPWARTMLVNGRSVAGTVSPRSPRLEDVRLTPGLHEVSFSGASETGTSTARIRWRDAYPTL